MNPPWRSADTLAHQAVMLNNPWFAALPRALRDEIFRRSRLRWLDDGAELFLRGDPPDAWHGVFHGAIKVRSYSHDGREVVLTYLEPGAWFGEIAFVDGLPRSHDGVAYGRTGLFSLPADDFTALLHAEPAFSRALLQLQSARLRLMFTAFEDQSTLSLEVRLARQLRALIGAYGKEVDGAMQIELHLPQDGLAQLLGVSRQRINQTMKAWERTGVLQQRYGRIQIDDLDALNALAEPS